MKALEQNSMKLNSTFTFIFILLSLNSSLTWDGQIMIKDLRAST